MTELGKMKVRGLAGRLKAAREMEDMLPADVAKALGCSNTERSRYERGNREPGLYNLVRLARVLGVSTDWLLTGKKGKP